MSPQPLVKTQTNPSIAKTTSKNVPADASPQIPIKPVELQPPQEQEPAANLSASEDNPCQSDQIDQQPKQ